MTPNEQTQKQDAVTFFKSLRDQICKKFEDLEDHYTGEKNNHEPAGRFTFKTWEREALESEKGHTGGGTMGLMKGRVFEKVGVNFSEVQGEFSKEFRSKIPGTEDDPRFWASGVSLVAHMHSPLVPAVHMNVRHIRTKNKTWFGGGADLTPTFPNQSDTQHFHNALKQACDKHDESYYPKFKEQCDSYFFLPHRNETRGVGGIFFDYLNTGEWNKDFDFLKSAGLAFLDAFPPLVEKHMNTQWAEEQRYELLKKRGRYVEFNLLYDRGTTFGLKTGGNTEAILMSMPPEVIWV